MEILGMSEDDWDYLLTDEEKQQVLAKLNTVVGRRCVRTAGLSGVPSRWPGVEVVPLQRISPRPLLCRST